MKKLTILLLIIIAAACTQKQDEGVKVVYEGYYLGAYDLPDSPGYAEDEDNLGKVADLKDKVRELGKAKGFEERSYQYNLFVDKSGKLTRIEVLSEHRDDIDKLLVNELQKLNYKAGEHKGVKKNATFRARFNSSEFEVAVEEMPMPIGGIGAIQKKVRYPEIAKRAGIQGRVFVKAYIDENGDVAKTELIKGIGAGCDEAAIKAIEETKFKPGINHGKNVKTMVTVPILFKLQ